MDKHPYKVLEGLEAIEVVYALGARPRDIPDWWAGSREEIANKFVRHYDPLIRGEKFNFYEGLTLHVITDRNRRVLGVYTDPVTCLAEHAELILDSGWMKFAETDEYTFSRILSLLPNAPEGAEYDFDYQEPNIVLRDTAYTLRSYEGRLVPHILKSEDDEGLGLEMWPEDEWVPKLDLLDAESGVVLLEIADHGATTYVHPGFRAVNELMGYAHKLDDHMGVHWLPGVVTHADILISCGISRSFTQRISASVRIDYDTFKCDREKLGKVLSCALEYRKHVLDEARLRIASIEKDGRPAPRVSCLEDLCAPELWTILGAA